MITHDYLVVTFVIIVAVVVIVGIFCFFLFFLAAALAAWFVGGVSQVFVSIAQLLLLGLLDSVDFFLLVAKEVDHIVVQDLSFFIVAELVDIVSKDVLRCGGKLWSLISRSNRAETERSIYQTARLVDD